MKDIRNSKITVDFVLLPSIEIIDLAIRINHQFDQPANKRLFLDRNLCIPHISLLMGCVEISQLNKVTNQLHKFSEDYTSFDLEISGWVLRNGNTSFEIRKTDKLQQFHNQLVDRFKEVCTYDASPETFFGDTKAGPSAINWVNTFIENSSYEKFWPHITLGFGEITKDIKFPLYFKSQQIGMYHLGEHCTCQKEICLFNMKN